MASQLTMEEREVISQMRYMQVKAIRKSLALSGEIAARLDVNSSETARVIGILQLSRMGWPGLAAAAVGGAIEKWSRKSLCSWFSVDWSDSGHQIKLPDVYDANFGTTRVDKSAGKRSTTGLQNKRSEAAVSGRAICVLLTSDDVFAATAQCPLGRSSVALRRLGRRHHRGRPSSRHTGHERGTKVRLSVGEQDIRSEGVSSKSGDWAPISPHAENASENNYLRSGERIQRAPGVSRKDTTGGLLCRPLLFLAARYE